MIIKKYTAKPVVVEAVQITEDNMADVAKWCKGDVRSELVPASESETGEEYTRKYVKPKMYKAPNSRPTNPKIEDRLTKGYVGKWIIKRGTNFKVYTDQAFANSYDDGAGLPLAEARHREEASPALFNGMVEELSRARETHLAVSGHETTFVTPAAGVPMREFPKRTIDEIAADRQGQLENLQRRQEDPNVGLFVEAVPTGFEKPEQ